MTYYANESYGPDPWHTYDLSTRYGSSDILLVLVHGGGWTQGDKRAGNFDNGECVKYISERYGMSVASINYTLATPETPTAPTNVDKKASHRSWHYDPTNAMNMPSANVLHASQLLRRKTKARRVILLGSSAGANIAALTYQFWPIEFEGFIGFYGVYDLLANDFSSIVKERIDIYTGNHFDKLQGGSLMYRSFPESFLLFHGAEDEHVQLSQSSKMHQRHGGELHVVNGHGHSFNVFGDKDNPAPWMERIVRYCYVG